MLSQQGYHQEALASLDKAIQIQPNYYILWFERGSVLENLKRSQEEIAAYSKAIELKPSAILYAGRGTAHLVILLRKIFNSNPVGDTKLSEEILDSSNTIEDLQKAATLFRAERDMVAYQRVLDMLGELRQ